MILLDNHLADLARGFERISQVERWLQTEGRARLLQSYAQRREKYARARQAHAEKIGLLRKQLTTIAFVPGTMFIGGLGIAGAGAWLSAPLNIGLAPSIGGLALAFAGLVGLALLAIFLLWQFQITKPAPPAHPLRDDVLARVLPQWRAKLRGELPAPSSAFGDAGEHTFVAHLQTLPIDSMYVLYGVQQKPGDDVDTIVLGAKGIWVFEVKHWGGRVSWRAGEWIHERFDPARQTWTRADEQPPDQQRQRMVDEITKTLTMRAPDLVKRFPALRQIKGGVVFTISKTIYDVPADCPARWGFVSGWDKEIADTPIIPGVDARAIFLLLDALLDRHHEIDKDAPITSMSAHATKIARQAETRVDDWVAHE